MILISTKRGDIHASALLWALEQLSIESQAIYPAEIIKDRDRFFFRTSNEERHICANSITDLAEKAKAIWFRKFPHSLRSNSTQEELSEFEQGNIDETYSTYAIDLQYSLASLVNSINAPQNVLPFIGKMHQLALAERCGFKVPDTIITASAEQALKHFGSNRDIVYKPYRHNAWQLKDGSFRFAPTSIISTGELESGDISPAIFQQHINKVAEYRVVVLGQRIITMAQRPKQAERQIDWRDMLSGQYEFQIAELPEAVQRCCHNFMTQSRLDCAAIDIAQNESGDYYFLEVNPSGQFLFIEEFCPEAKMLQAAIRLIIEKAGLSISASSLENITMAAFRKAHKSDYDESYRGTGADFFDLMSRRTFSVHQQ